MVMNRYAKYCSESFIKIVVLYLHKYDAPLKDEETETKGNTMGFPGWLLTDLQD